MEKYSSDKNHYKVPESMYTKMARPTVAYVGILLVCWKVVFAPMLGYDTGEAPEVFWQAWGWAIGVYVAGRSAEKVLGSNKFQGGNKSQDGDNAEG